VCVCVCVCVCLCVCVCVYVCVCVFCERSLVRNRLAQSHFEKGEKAPEGFIF
jgi:hypothetical protein